jgi:cytochrome c-type biogenesis protein CcmH/NrfF
VQNQKEARIAELRERVRVQREKNEKIKQSTEQVAKMVRKQPITRAEFESGK